MLRTAAAPASPPRRRLARWSRALGLGRLSTRLLLLVLLAAVPAFAVQVYDELEARERRRAEVAEQVEQMAGLAAGQLDRLVEGAQTVLATLGHFPSIRGRNGAACGELLARLARRFPTFGAIAAATPGGDIFCSSGPPALGINVADRTYFKRALARKASTVSDLLKGRAAGNDILIVAQPIPDDAGAGVETMMLLAFYPETLSQLLSRVPLPDGTVIGVLDHSGRIAARFPEAPELIGAPAKNELFVRTLFAGDEGSVAGEGPDGVRRFYGYAHSDEAPNLVAYVGLAERRIFAAADRLLLQNLALLGGWFVLAAGAAAWFGAYAIRRPILEVRGAIDRMARGDLSARTEPGRSGIEELAGLAQSFDEMARRRAAAEERQRVLVRELNHRIKNAFALVRSVAMQTRRHSPDLETFERAFLGRLDALARVSTLLTATEGAETVDLGELAEAALEPFCTDGGLRIGGPGVALPPPTARTLSLALHELATNAAKYGALSAPGGRVELAWRVEAAPPGDRRLVVEWTERGGPGVRPPERQGFGCTLIERSVAYELDGTARLEFPPDGVRCHIEVPLEAGAAPEAGITPPRA